MVLAAGVGGGQSCPAFFLTPFCPGGHIPDGPRRGTGTPGTAGAAHNQGPRSCLWPLQPAAPPHFAEGEVPEREGMEVMVGTT